MDQETQDKLAKLEKMEKAGRERARKYIEKVRADGRMQISAIISKEAYNEIRRMIDKSLLEGTRATMGSVIESLLFTNVTANVSIDVAPEPKEDDRQLELFDDQGKVKIKTDIPKATDTPEPETMVKPAPVALGGEDLPDYHGKTVTTEERDLIVLKVAAMFNGKGCGQRRVEALNRAGVPTQGGEPWTSKKVSDAKFLALYRKRQGKK